MDVTSLEFVYCSIPENEERRFRAGLALNYKDVQHAIEQLRSKVLRNGHWDMALPGRLACRRMHLDPDFHYLTYGDNGENQRGERLTQLKRDDLLVFYAGLKPITRCDHKLIYALIGLFTVSKVERVADLLALKQYDQNAHTRRLGSRPSDVVVRGQPGKPGRLERCVPIGEWRDKAYRVVPWIEAAWGGLDITDGYLQRNGVPPFFRNAGTFQKWLSKQNLNFVPRNN